MLSLVTPATVEPVSVDELRDHLRVDGDDDEAYLGSLISAVRDYWFGIDGFGYVLTDEAFDLTLDCWPDVIRLPRAPVRSVEAITYLDTIGVEQTLAPDQYVVTADRHGPGLVHPSYGVTWPALRTQPDAVTVRFKAGFGSGWNDVPEDIKIALKQIVTQWYDNRMPINVGNIVNTLPFAAQAILGKYRLHSFG